MLPSRGLDFVAEGLNTLSARFDDKPEPVYGSLGGIVGYQSDQSPFEVVVEAGSLLLGMGIKALAHPIQMYNTYKQMRGRN